MGNFTTGKLVTGNLAARKSSRGKSRREEISHMEISPHGKFAAQKIHRGQSKKKNCAKIFLDLIFLFFILGLETNLVNSFLPHVPTPAGRNEAVAYILPDPFYMCGNKKLRSEIRKIWLNRQ